MRLSQANILLSTLASDVVYIQMKAERQLVIVSHER